MVSEVYSLSRSYLDLLWYFRFPPIFMPKLCSGGGGGGLGV